MQNRKVHQYLPPTEKRVWRQTPQTMAGIPVYTVGENFEKDL